MEFLDFELRIKQAAAWLDVRYPGWAEKIDLNNFDMEDPDCCIGSYLGVRWDLDLREGFSKDTGVSGWGAFAGFNFEWRKEIRARTPAPVPVYGLA